MRMPDITAATSSAWSVVVLQLNLSDCLQLCCYSTLLLLIILVNACRASMQCRHCLAWAATCRWSVGHLERTHIHFGGRKSNRRPV